MNKHSLHSIVIIGICLFMFLACSEAPSLSPVNINGDGVAIKGYDPVAYFTMDRPVKGKTEYQLEWNSAKWLFANKEHLAMFEENPEKFAPQYGGY